MNGISFLSQRHCARVSGERFGLRVSELLSLKVEDIDLDNAQIHLERLKNGKIHDPAVSKALVRTLKAYIKKRGGVLPQLEMEKAFIR
jgi:integrase